MKKMFFVLMILFSGTQAFNQQKQFKDLIGRWEIISDQNDGASLEVIDSSTIILYYMGEKKKLTDYKIDFQRSPIWFDFSTADSTSNVSVKSLLEIIDDSMIKWQLFVDEDRTDHFSSTKGELYYLRKAKPTTIGAAIANNQ
ncbi:MAG: hypothetical protein E6H08_12410 [Bacteroidetes bacterium]|nr:MAG: hypothetical protein E6H08_12410 [Bacteroidota bacterium]